MKVSSGRLLPGLRLPVLRTGVIAVEPVLAPADSYMMRELRFPLGFLAAAAAEEVRPFRIIRH